MADLVKILLMDKDPKYLYSTLPYYGYEVDCAENPDDLCKKLDDGMYYDMLLLSDDISVITDIRNSDLYGDVPIIVISSDSDDKKMIKGLKLGADDYLIKPFVIPNLLARIEAVLRRVKRNPVKKIVPNVTNPQEANSKLLTEREKDVLLLVAKGFSNRQIAEELFVSTVTIKVHITSIMHKLDLTNRVELAIYAVKNNLVDINTYSRR